MDAAIRRVALVTGPPETARTSSRRDIAMLTRDEIETLHNAERLTKEVWRIVAKDRGCSPEEYARVHYGQRLQDFLCALERNPL